MLITNISSDIRKTISFSSVPR